MIPSILLQTPNIFHVPLVLLEYPFCPTARHQYIPSQSIVPVHDFSPLLFSEPDKHLKRKGADPSSPHPHLKTLPFCFSPSQRAKQTGPDAHGFPPQHPPLPFVSPNTQNREYSSAESTPYARALFARLKHYAPKQSFLDLRIPIVNVRIT